MLLPQQMPQVLRNLASKGASSPTQRTAPFGVTVKKFSPKTN